MEGLWEENFLIVCLWTPLGGVKEHWQNVTGLGLKQQQQQQQIIRSRISLDD